MAWSGEERKRSNVNTPSFLGCICEFLNTGKFRRVSFPGCGLYIILFLRIICALEERETRLLLQIFTGVNRTAIWTPKWSSLRTSNACKWYASECCPQYLDRLLFSACIYEHMHKTSLRSEQSIDTQAIILYVVLAPKRRRSLTTVFKRSVIERAPQLIILKDI